MFKICFDIWPYIINFSTAGCVFIMDEFIFKFKGWENSKRKGKLFFKKFPFLDFFYFSHTYLVVMYGVVPHWISTNLMGTKLGKFFNLKNMKKKVYELRSERKSPTAKKPHSTSSSRLHFLFTMWTICKYYYFFHILLSSLTSHILGIEFNYFIFPLINEKISKRFYLFFLHAFKWHLVWFSSKK